MRKKLLCLILGLLVLFTLSFTSCGETKEDESGAEEEASARAAVSLNMWIICDENVSAETEALVEEAFNEVTQAKFTTKVDLIFLTENEYYDALDDKLNLANELKDESDSGLILLPGFGAETTEVVETTAETFVNELGQRLLKYPDIENGQVDIIFLAGEELLKRYADEGKLLGLDSNLNATSKVLKDYIYPSFLNQVKYNNSTYAIPNNHLIGDYTYLLVNKELAEKYYIDATKLNSFADCEKLIVDIGTNETDIAPVLAYAEPTNMHYWLDYTTDNEGEMSIIASYVPAQAAYGDRTPMRSVFDIAGFTNHMLLMKKCEQNGWFAKDPENTETFGVAVIKGGNEVVKKYGDKYEVKVLSYPVLDENDVYGSMFAISAYTANFDRAMEIITFFNTDKEAKNILQYGVKGVQYKFDEDDNFVTLTDDYKMNNEYTGNAFLAYSNETMAADIWDNAKVANLDSRVSPYFGLASAWADVDTDAVDELKELSNEYIARMNACKTEAELADFFAAAKAELSENEIFKAALAADGESLNAVYTKWGTSNWIEVE